MKIFTFTFFISIALMSLKCNNNANSNSATGAGSNESTRKGIVFYEGTWQQALDSAKKTNKLIFLDIYTTWCGPCRVLKEKTFPNSEVGAYFNSHFINMSIDAEVGDGLALSEVYQIQGYPTLLFINGNGEVIGGTMGYQTPDALLQLGKRYGK